MQLPTSKVELLDHNIADQGYKGLFSKLSRIENYELRHSLHHNNVYTKHKTSGGPGPAEVCHDICFEGWSGTARNDTVPDVKWVVFH